ncbi:ABC transporter substrate-binding protein [Nocardiopsis sp. NRRL B-16309]|uniref:ABC transporter substrate-binding protein n=1 Tax=Nocardiopsis sp. NRRL B-16309 TaxID=1519494 RepID=UPI0006AE7387|nr:ABC transporter substrate-binding protein [Nocardiopsis sp. NRRL B-16309]KOX12448.1 sulfonate ABC transporter substrate-binding protein [Nocardiopsis sp. NRRL B-16309]
MSVRTPVLAAAALAVSLAAVGCAALGGPDDGDDLTVGYLTNITHAPALVADHDDAYADALGADARVAVQTFNAGPDLVNALFSGEVDAAFIGPNPTINGWAQSEGAALRVVAGSTSGGAGLVVRTGIDDVDDLVGTTLSTPQLGNTQDVALRHFAAEQGWEVDTAGGGDLSIIPQQNAEIVDAFALGEIDGAFLPEPHLSRLLREHGGHLLVDEADLWPETGGAFVTANLVVGADYLDTHPDRVERLLRAHLDTVDRMNADPEQAQRTAADQLAEVTGSRLPAGTVESAFGRLEFTVDPIAPSLAAGAGHAESAGLLDPVDLDGLYALEPLNDLLAQDGRDQITGPQEDK